jgi:hypothetical protein
MLFTVARYIERWMNINMHDSTEVSARKHDKQNETLCDICGRHMHAHTRAGTTRSSINMQTFPLLFTVLLFV